MSSLRKCIRVLPSEMCMFAGTITLFSLFAVVAPASNSPWYQELCSYTWQAIDQDSGVRYTLKLCDSGPTTKCGQGSAVCAHHLVGDNHQSVGEHSRLTASESVLDFGTAEKCSDGRPVRSSISFQCGKTLGTPEFVTVSECVHYFEWRTYVVCKKDKFKPHNEVPCYVFDTDGKKHDLSPLIKLTDGYLVDDTDDTVDLYINICRSITRSGSPCPEESAACLDIGTSSYGVGRPTQPLELYSNDRLQLHYESNGTAKPESCGEHTPAVTITFNCPSQRQQGADPRLTAKTNCRYEIEWVTEYACHRDYLESSNCTFTSTQHDVSIDLSPLTLSDSELPYYASSKSADGNENYSYYLNVCGTTKASGCSDAKGYVSACQVKDNGDVTKIAGRYQNQTLRYSDGDLTLIYPGGSTCSSGFQRMTIINFECDKTAGNEGKGTPVFTGESDCTYYFNWLTKYACIKEKEDLLCSFSDGKKRYDLSPLIRYPDSNALQNWEAVKPSGQEATSMRFYINVCHRVLQQGAASGCPEDAAICAVSEPGAGKGKLSLGKFLSAPQKRDKSISLIYTEGNKCINDNRTTTTIRLFCKPGDLESAPQLRHMASCEYEFEWHTAAACVLSKTDGNDCRVSDLQAGFSFDLSPLTKHGDIYNISSGEYTYLLNVCDKVSAGSCPDKAGACQMDKSGKTWSLGEFNSSLSYYNGMIKLAYLNGSQYNDKNHTPRSTLISFLCDREAGVGHPEYQVEDEFTYNFRWYTTYACPEKPLECMVTDTHSLQQYDLSSLSRAEGYGAKNWEAIDSSTKRKYYINVCRPLNAVPGCDRLASVCEMKYEPQEGGATEKVSISNLGMAKSSPIVMEEDHLLLEYTEGSACDLMGQKMSFTTRIHMVCQRGALASGPRFLMFLNCTASFLWHTEAACAISTTEDKNQTCSMKDPNSGFEFNLLPLASNNSYTAQGNSKTFKVNICSVAKECSKDGGQAAAGCEIENGQPTALVGVEKSLQFSTDGQLTLVYEGRRDKPTGTRDTFTIGFVCDQDENPGTLSLVREEMSTTSHVIHDVFFEFRTSLACMPAPVDCHVIDPHGNEYDLGDLSRDDKAWVAIDTSQSTRSQTFYINICKPLPRVPGCPGGALGACAKLGQKFVNLGYVQSSPQVAADGSISIVYLNGDKCEAGHYSTRIIFECDDTPGSPMFDRMDGCEYVFIWRTSEACPIHRVQGENCQVRDPRSGHVFDLTPLSSKDYQVTSGKYQYRLAVCAGIQRDICRHKGNNTVASCQVSGNTHKIAGLSTQNITYDDGLIMINYTQGETCHKIYERSTAIIFICDHSRSTFQGSKNYLIQVKGDEEGAVECFIGKGTPEFIRETPDCTYVFEWHTALACLPFETTSCTYNDGNGNSYDLSPLSLSRDNWVADARDAQERYYINVCKSLVPQSGAWSCPSSSASCLKNNKAYVNLGEVQSGPELEQNVLVLKYSNGAPCPGGQRNRTTLLRFRCNEDKVDSRPSLETVLEDCVYTFMWFTTAACPLKSSVHGDCQVTNPRTGRLFNLSSLTKKGGYTLYDRTNRRKMYRLNVCADVPDSWCTEGTGVCIKDSQTALSAGKASTELSYRDQVVQLTYAGGSPCRANPALQHKSIISFVCKARGGPPEGDGPVHVDSDECVHFFSWHTPLVCEQKSVSCSVRNGTSLIDLSPLIHRTGHYQAIDTSLGEDRSPDFYINICEPLNPIPGVTCPPGVAVCMDPVDGPPMDIGRITGPPTLNNNEVSISFNSSTACPTNLTLTYSSVIRFTCQQGTELGTPQMISKVQCQYVFEWATPLVCPDTVAMQGCSLTDSQLQFTFNLSSLAGTVVRVPSSSGTYSISVCGAVAEPRCRNSAACQLSGTAAYSFGNSKAMKMDYRHQDEALVLQYDGGDPCPRVTTKGELCVFPFVYMKKAYSNCTADGSTEGLWCATTDSYDRDRKWGVCAEVKDKRRSSILFTCDRSAGRGAPTLLSETQGCAVTFQWATDAICPPKKMGCKFVHEHQTYDLSTLSSLTAPWRFTQDGKAYYLNLCQGIHASLTNCPKDSALCLRGRDGLTQSLGRVHTQTMEYIDKKIQVNYTLGAKACGNNKAAKTMVQLSCGSTVGNPRLLRVDEEACEFWVSWETRAACPVATQEVEMVNGTIRVPNTGANFSLGALYFSLHRASGDIRSNGDKYIYDIQLSGITNGSSSVCTGANICQVKMNGPYSRRIGSSSKVKYFIKDGNLDVLVASESQCGRDKSKMVSSTILFHCSPTVGEGIPEFLLEADGCQYLFIWHTSTVCALFKVDNNELPPDGGEEHVGLSRRSQAVGAVLSLLLVVLTACLLILLLYKQERRELVIQKVSGCCRRGNSMSYKYSKVNTEEVGEEDETEWLMEEMEPPESSSRRGKEVQENGHVTTRAVHADALRSLPLDEQDSEDEVLTVPGVRVHVTRPAISQHRPRRAPLKGRRESDEDLVGLLEEDERGGRLKGKLKPHRKQAPNPDSFHDDSDEDLLNV